MAKCKTILSYLDDLKKILRKKYPQWNERSISYEAEKIISGWQKSDSIAWKKISGLPKTEKKPGTSQQTGNAFERLRDHAWKQILQKAKNEQVRDTGSLFSLERARWGSTITNAQKKFEKIYGIDPFTGKRLKPEDTTSFDYMDLNTLAYETGFNETWEKPAKAKSEDTSNEGRSSYDKATKGDEEKIVYPWEREYFESWFDLSEEKKQRMLERKFDPSGMLDFAIEDSMDTDQSIMKRFWADEETRRKRRKETTEDMNEVIDNIIGEHNIDYNKAHDIVRGFNMGPGGEFTMWDLKDNAVYIKEMLKNKTIKFKDESLFSIDDVDAIISGDSFNPENIFEFSKEMADINDIRNIRLEALRMSGQNSFESSVSGLPEAYKNLDNALSKKSDVTIKESSDKYVSKLIRGKAELDGLDEIVRDELINKYGELTTKEVSEDYEGDITGTADDLGTITSRVNPDDVVDIIRDVIMADSAKIINKETFNNFRDVNWDNVIDKTISQELNDVKKIIKDASEIDELKYNLNEIESDYIDVARNIDEEIKKKSGNVNNADVKRLYELFVDSELMAQKTKLKTLSNDIQKEFFNLSDKSDPLKILSSMDKIAKGKRDVYSMDKLSYTKKEKFETMAALYRSEGKNIFIELNAKNNLITVSHIVGTTGRLGLTPIVKTLGYHNLENGIWSPQDSAIDNMAKNIVAKEHLNIDEYNKYKSAQKINVLNNVLNKLSNQISKLREEFDEGEYNLLKSTKRLTSPISDDMISRRNVIVPSDENKIGLYLIRKQEFKKYIRKNRLYNSYAKLSYNEMYKQFFGESTAKYVDINPGNTIGQHHMYVNDNYDGKNNRALMNLFIKPEGDGFKVIWGEGSMTYDPIHIDETHPMYNQIKMRYDYSGTGNTREKSIINLINKASNRKNRLFVQETKNMIYDNFISEDPVKSTNDVMQAIKKMSNITTNNGNVDLKHVRRVVWEAMNINASPKRKAEILQNVSRGLFGEPNSLHNLTNIENKSGGEVSTAIKLVRAMSDVSPKANHYTDEFVNNFINIAEEDLPSEYFTEYRPSLTSYVFEKLKNVNKDISYIELDIVNKRNKVKLLERQKSDKLKNLTKPLTERDNPKLYKEVRDLQKEIKSVQKELDLSRVEKTKKIFLGNIYKTAGTPERAEFIISEFNKAVENGEWESGETTIKPGSDKITSYNISDILNQYDLEPTTRSEPGVGYEGYDEDAGVGERVMTESPDILEERKEIKSLEDLNPNDTLTFSRIVKKLDRLSKLRYNIDMSTEHAVNEIEAYGQSWGMGDAVEEIKSYGKAGERAYGRYSITKHRELFEGLPELYSGLRSISYKENNLSSDEIVESKILSADPDTNIDEQTITNEKQDCL